MSPDEIARLLDFMADQFEEQTQHFRGQGAVVGVILSILTKVFRQAARRAAAS